MWICSLSLSLIEFNRFRLPLRSPCLSCPILAFLSLSLRRVRVRLPLWCLWCPIRETADPRIDATVPVPRPSVLSLQVLASGGSDGHETTCSATRYREARGGKPLIAGIKSGRWLRSDGELEPMPTRRDTRMMGGRVERGWDGMGWD
jgi:hypothetical protein